MPYPQLLIDLSKLEDNVRQLKADMDAAGMHVMGVNKVFNGALPPARALVRGGVEVVAESSVANLAGLAQLPCAKALLRSPALSEVEQAVRYADISLNSEPEILRALARAAAAQGKTHQILLMVDLGDLREGIWYEDEEAILEALDAVLSAASLSLYGLGTNFNCYGTVLPTPTNAAAFVALARRLEQRLGISFPYLSGGNCTSYHLIDKGIMPPGINQLRIGGQYQFGLEYVDVKYLPGYHHSRKVAALCASDLFLLQGEVIEGGRKPTLPVGELGKDAFMRFKTFCDRGWRRRCILNFGLQDVPAENIYPVDPGITILGQTSNHTLVDVEEATLPSALGDVIEFELDYTALMFACNAPGIRKVYHSSPEGEGERGPGVRPAEEGGTSRDRDG